MKKLITIVLCLLLTLAMVGCGKTYHGTDELIEKARKEIPIADAETTDIAYVGMSANGDKAIAWFISGNEYQAHYYLPLEFEVVGEDTYKFVRTYKSMGQADDIAMLLWERGYCFLINNPKCVEVEIYNNDGSLHRVSIENDSYPYLFYWEEIPSEYSFIDKDGNAFNR